MLPLTIQPLPARFETRQAHALMNAGRAAPQQVVVELAPANPVADRTAIVRIARRAAADTTGPEAGDGLQNAPDAIFGRIDVKRRQNRRSDPAAANLVTGEGLPVDNSDVEAGISETPGAGRASRSAADDQDVAGVHAEFSRRSR